VITVLLLMILLALAGISYWLFRIQRHLADIRFSGNHASYQIQRLHDDTARWHGEDPPF
jgi:hypothetical protein